MDGSNALRAFWVVRDKAGLQAGSWHTLRHSFATHLLLNKTDVEAVSCHLGHNRTSVAQDVYRHIGDRGRRYEILRRSGALRASRSAGTWNSVRTAACLGASDLVMFALAWPI